LGQSAYQILQRSTDNINTFDSFDDLAIPYRAVASDIATAKMVVLDSGNLNTAMKASAAVPGIVSAVEINGQMLVDGGITNNMPISVVKGMGADIVIAVDIGSPLVDQNELTSTVAVLGQLSTILTNNTSLSQKKLLGNQDILLRPHIEQLSTTDWSVMPAALKLGEEAALAKQNVLQKLSVSKADYQRYKQEKRSKSQQWFNQLASNIIDIKFNNNSRVDNKILALHFAVELNKPLNKEQLDAAINRVYALNKFEQVTVSFDDTVNGRILTLTTKAKSWGPNYFDFGFNIKTTFTESSSIMSLNMSYLMTDVSNNSGQWLNELELGWETLIASEFYQPLNQSQQFYSKIRGMYAHEKWEKAELHPELKQTYLQGSLSLGYNYSLNGIVELGIKTEKGNLATDQVIPNTLFNDDLDYESAGIFFMLGYDTLNSINFPTQGNKFTLKIEQLNDTYTPQLSSSINDEALVVTLDWRGAIGFDGHTFVGITSLSTVDNVADFSVNVSELGGFLNLSGYQEDAFIGAHKAFAAIVYQYDLGRDFLGSAGLPIYLGTSLEAGKVWEINESVRLSDIIPAASLYLGTDTSFGPAAFGIGFAPEGEYSIFLSIGKNWQ
jgi:NTE family protein